MQTSRDIGREGDGIFLVKWVKYDRSSGTRQIWPSGRECHHCWDTKRRFFDSALPELVGAKKGNPTSGT
eukprot:5385187-Pyramimonas_sp.AAC.1